MIYLFFTPFGVLEDIFSSIRGIADIFEWFADTLITLVVFLLNLIESLIQFLGLVPIVLTFITSSIGYLPTVVMGFASVTITIAILYLILGRNGD